MTAEKARDVRRTIRYSDGGREVLVVVPWGPHSGMIPPPSITFAGAWFGYDGDGPDVTIPPERNTNG